MSLPIVKLGEYVAVQNGYAFKSEEYAEFGHFVMRITNVQQGYISNNNPKYVAIQDNSKLKQFILDEGDILMSLTGDVGRVGVIKKNHLPAVLNQRVAKLKIKSKAVDKNYLFWFLNSESTRIKIESYGYGVAQKNVSSKQIELLEIPLPPLAEQQRIAAILDKAELVKRKRQLANEKLDELAQSVFIEMFGDPIKNEKGWKIVKLSQLVYKLGSGSTPTGGDASYKDFGISLIRSLNVHNGKFKYKNLAYIDDVQAKKLSNVSVESGDILLNITGASVARVCVTPNNVLPARVNQHVMIIRPKEIVNNIFLEKLLLTKQMQNNLLGISGSGATRESITKAQAEELEIILPEINLQNKFSAVMMEIEKLALKENFGENSIVNLLNSIQSKAFSGQL